MEAWPYNTGGRSRQVDTDTRSVHSDVRPVSVVLCSHVTSASAFASKRQEWLLWQQVLVFTRNICVFKNRMAKITEKNAKADIMCEWTFK